MDSALEYRFNEGIEIRGATGFLAVLAGIAAPFFRDSVPLTKAGGKSFIERIAAGAFRRTLWENPDVVALSMHNIDMPIARTPKTLTLAEQSAGLGYEMRLADTTAARDVVSGVRTGTIRGMSIAFIPVVEEWSARETVTIRTLLDVDLLEISAVTKPAYLDTTIAERSRERSREQFLELRSVHPEILTARVDHGRFVPGDAVPPPIAEKRGHLLTLNEFRARHPGFIFIEEIAFELGGVRDENGNFCVDGYELQKRCTDDDELTRAFDRICSRSDERLKSLRVFHRYGWEAQGHPPPSLF